MPGGIGSDQSDTLERVIGVVEVVEVVEVGHCHGSCCIHHGLGTHPVHGHLDYLRGSFHDFGAVGHHLDHLDEVRLVPEYREDLGAGVEVDPAEGVADRCYHCWDCAGVEAAEC